MRSRVVRRRRSTRPATNAAADSSQPFRRTLGAIPGPESGHVTETLYSRLGPDQVAAVESQLREEHRPWWDAASPDGRKALTLALGLEYRVPGVSERTGLVAATPPRSVHSMVHGNVTETGGSYFLADMVMEMLLGIARPLSPGAQALDFSCSSGRVVRPLAAALPEIRWWGCDPNKGAIAWAAANVPGIEFFVSETDPPLPLADGQLSLAFAISVWSHYSAAAALRWLEEMARVVRPRGHLLLTTHGLNSCSWFSYARDAALPIETTLGPDWISRTVDRLDRDGHCFWDVFGQGGDWGVVDSDWGLAFFTPEWLLANVTPTWTLQVYRIGRAHGNQDVYLLERA